jgi:hypothetical protein
LTPLACITQWGLKKVNFFNAFLGAGMDSYYNILDNVFFICDEALKYRENPGLKPDRQMELKMELHKANGEIYNLSGIDEVEKTKLLIGCLLNMQAKLEKEPQAANFLKEINELIKSQNYEILFSGTEARHAYNKFKGIDDLQQSTTATNISKQSPANSKPSGEIPPYNELKAATQKMLQKHVEVNHLFGELLMSKRKSQSLERIIQRIGDCDKMNSSFEQNPTAIRSTSDTKGITTSQFLIKTLIAESEKISHSRFSNSKESQYKKDIEAFLKTTLKVDSMDAVKKIVGYTQPAAKTATLDQVKVEDSPRKGPEKG